MNWIKHTGRLLAIALILPPLMICPVLRAQTEQPAKTKSGYSDSGTLESPDGVAHQLEEDDMDLGAVFRPPLLDGFFQPWYDFKRELNKKYGLQLQFNYQSLYQIASETLTDEDEAAAGRFQFQGMWTLLDREGKNPGALSFRLEERHALGTDVVPTQLGQQFGDLVPVGNGFSDFGIAITEVAWRQTILDGRMKFGFGKISAITWYNTHALSGSLTGFQDTALQSSLTKPVVGRGIGAVAGAKLGEDFVLIAGIHDANAETAGNPFDTIDEGKFYYSTEVRWLPNSFERRKTDQVRMQLWYVDETQDGAIPSGYGVTFAASKLFYDSVMPFVLAGISDGDATLMKADATAGVGFAFNTSHRAARDVLGMAVSYGKPGNDILQEQVSSEIFYRFQLFQNFAITPSAQLIVNPAANPVDDTVWLFGLRGRLTF